MTPARPASGGCRRRAGLPAEARERGGSWPRSRRGSRVALRPRSSPGSPGVGTTLAAARARGARARATHRFVLFSPFLHLEPEFLERWLGCGSRSAQRPPSRSATTSPASVRSRVYEPAPDPRRCARCGAGHARRARSAARDARALVARLPRRVRKRRAFVLCDLVRLTREGEDALSLARVVRPRSADSAAPGRGGLRASRARRRAAPARARGRRISTQSSRPPKARRACLRNALMVRCARLASAPPPEPEALSLSTTEVRAQRDEPDTQGKRQRSTGRRLVAFAPMRRAAFASGAGGSPRHPRAPASLFPLVVTRWRGRRSGPRRDM